MKHNSFGWSGGGHGLVARLILVLVVFALGSVPGFAGQAARPRPPLSMTDVEGFWAKRAQSLFLNELKLRKLAFDPEEDWINGLAAKTGVQPSEIPAMAAALIGLVAPAPPLDEVERQAPEILTRVRTAVTQRDEKALESLLHRELLANRDRVVKLFDPANYQSHQLGKFAAQPSRRVGVQLFRLTTGQVEIFYYVLFATSQGTLKVRDVLTGPEIAAQFLEVEQRLAVEKLRTAFRGLFVERDEREFRGICTPAFYEHLRERGAADLEGGASVPNPRTFDAIKLTPSVPLEQKSVRVVVRVSYPTRSGKQLEFDVEFERLDPNLRIVRLRDTSGGWIAWDAQLENYLNKRYALDAGPPIDPLMVPETELLEFLGREQLIRRGVSGVEDRNVALVAEIARVMADRDPQEGRGAGMRAGAAFIAQRYEEAEREGLRAIERGAPAYVVVSRHKTGVVSTSRQFFPIVLAISKDRIRYQPVKSVGTGELPEEIPTSAIEKVEMEKGNVLRPARPFLSFRFKAGKDSKNYNFAAFGTRCSQDQVAGGERRVPVGPHTGGNPCAPVLGDDQQRISTLVPEDYPENLTVVMRLIEAARQVGRAAPRR